MKKITLLALFILAFASLKAQSITTNTQTLDPVLSVKIDVTPTLVTVTMVGPSDAWFAVGFGGAMMSAGADVLRTNGTVLIDAKATSYSLPVADASQDWTEVSNTVAGADRIIVATRALDTGDVDDYVFSNTDTSVTMIWAHGTGTFAYGYHGNANRGSSVLSFTNLLGVEEFKLQGFSISPNPVSNELSLNFKTFLDETTVQIFNILGKQVYSKTVTSIDKLSSIDVSRFSKGVYLVRVVSEEVAHTRRFIKN